MDWEMFVEELRHEVFDRMTTPTKSLFAFTSKSNYNQYSSFILPCEIQLKFALREGKPSRFEDEREEGRKMNVDLVEYLCQLMPFLIGLFDRSSPWDNLSTILTYFDCNSLEKLMWIAKKDSEYSWERYEALDNEENKIEREHFVLQNLLLSEEMQTEARLKREKEINELEDAAMNKKVPIPDDTLLRRFLSSLDIPSESAIAAYLFQNPFDFDFVKAIISAYDKHGAIYGKKFNWKAMVEAGLSYIKTVEEADALIHLTRIDPAHLTIDLALFGGVELCQHLLDLGGQLTPDAYFFAAALMDKELFEWLQTRLALDTDQLKRKLKKNSFYLLWRVGKKSIDEIKYFADKGLLEKIIFRAFDLCAREGNVLLLKHLLDSKYSFKEPWCDLSASTSKIIVKFRDVTMRMQELVTVAIEYGQPEVLDLLLKAFDLRDLSFIFNSSLLKIIFKNLNPLFDFAKVASVIAKHLPFSDGKLQWPFTKRRKQKPISTVSDEMDLSWEERLLPMDDETILMKEAIENDFRLLFLWLLDHGFTFDFDPLIHITNKKVIHVKNSESDGEGEQKVEIYGRFTDFVQPWFISHLKERFPDELRNVS